MYSLANQTRIDNIVLNDAQNSQEQQHQKRRERPGMKYSQQRCYDGHQQWSNQWNKFANPGDDPQDERTRKSENGEANCAHQADKNAGGELCPDVSSERAVNVLKEFVTAPAPTSLGQSLQSGATESLHIF